MAVNWYFGIRESEYGWIKPENTVNVDEGGIMAGFGLDSLVIGSSDPRRKAFLKGSQSRTWTTFIEAVTADGRLLKPGIIFKGKELQQQWFIDEFRKIADWYYITSDNGWTDNHIAVEWLKEVYLPQAQPADESDARLIILDGHGSHVSDEWMATCFLNNVYCCYLPAHCSHGLRPLDNGVFNASKAAYRKELQKVTSLTDSAPVDKVNFIKAYAKAREVGMTKKNILSGWRVTGNWPISRRKALMHPEIQPDKKETTPGSDGHRDGQVDSDHTPTTSRHIRDLGKNKSPSTRRRYSVISRGFEAQESKIASLGTRIASLEKEVGRLSRGKKRKAIPNPNKRFMTLAEALVAGGAISEPNEAIERADAVEDVIEVGGMEEDERSNLEEEELTVVHTRAGREVRIPRKY
ncbi:Pogo transposable element with ZNF domain [Fusarium oxysporum f. sp. conglutinans]|nr:Pogo transposable element with ZNF domain [Fusarium oxysporum f. sp. conglutinans]